MKVRALGALFLALALAGCAGPQRAADPESFRLVQEGQVAPANVPKLVDCIVDGFDGARGGGYAIERRQIKRSEGTRIETFAGGWTHVSVDVLDSGSARFYELKSASLIPTKVQRDAFASCLKGLA